jgi:predicted DsbA family dithiol-disulfide isomerase/uncharacterized membrane protein
MKRAASAVALAFAVIGLAASIASAIDYFGADPTFCAESGCASAWSQPLGVPLPVLGIAFNLVALALCIVERPRLRVAVAIAGAAGGLGLISIQAFVVGAWCKLCLVADPSAIGYAAAVLVGAATVRPARAWLAAPGLAAGVAALALWTHGGEAATAHAPAVVRIAGTATVVEYVDFECPFCREMQKRLQTAIDRAKVPVQITRKMVALPQHKGALPAAVAWCCAVRQGKGDAMAEALFAADPAELTPAGCEKLAAKIGCDLERYRLDAPLAVGQVAVDMMDAKGAGIHGLPTLYVGTSEVVGASATVDDLVAMLRRAAN